MSRSVISFEGVSKRFVIQHHKARSFQDALINLVHRRAGTDEQFWALKDVSFDVHRGETLGIIGHNGSGKSTALKLMTRILDPTFGRVTVSGRVSALIELGAGFHPDLSGRENIYLNGSILGFSRRDMDRLFASIVEFSELEQFIDTPVKHYSSGMYARLGFSVAISVDPDILIVDEVLAVGDEAFQRKCFDRIAEFKRRGKTIVLVSHGLQMVEFLCDHAVWLDHGVVHGQGSVRPTILGYQAAMQQHDDENREHAHRAAAVEPGASASRLNDGEREDVEILAVQLRSVDSSEKYSFYTGDAVVLRIQYRLVDPTSEFVFGLQLRRNDGLLIHDSSERIALSSAANENGEGWFEVKIPNLPLLAGTYELLPTLFPLGRPQLAIPDTQRCVFSVWSDVDQSGIVALPYQCRSAAESLHVTGLTERQLKVRV